MNEEEEEEGVKEKEKENQGLLGRKKKKKEKKGVADGGQRGLYLIFDISVVRPSISEIRLAIVQWVHTPLHTPLHARCCLGHCSMPMRRRHVRPVNPHSPRCNQQKWRARICNQLTQTPPALQSRSAGWHTNCTIDRISTHPRALIGHCAITHSLCLLLTNGPWPRCFHRYPQISEWEDLSPRRVCPGKRSIAPPPAIVRSRHPPPSYWVALSPSFMLRQRLFFHARSFHAMDKQIPSLQIAPSSTFFFCIVTGVRPSVPIS